MEFLTEVCDDTLFGRGIERAGSLVEEEEVGGLHHQAGQGYSLALSTREVATLLADR